jgi:hypothetical protein
MVSDEDEDEDENENQENQAYNSFERRSVLFPSVGNPVEFQ